MYSRPTAPMSIGEVLDSAFELARATLPKVWGFALAGGLAALPSTLYDLTLPPEERALLFRDGVYWTLFAFGFVASIYCGALILLRQKAFVDGESAPAPYAEAARRLPFILFALVLYFVAVLAGLLLLIIPGLLFGVSLWLGTLLVLFERKGPFAALGGSHTLVMGSWWRTSVVLYTGFLIVFVLYFLLGVISGVIAPFMADGDTVLATAISLALVMVGVQVLIAPFMSALFISVYRDLKMRRQGVDLQARIQAL